MLSGRTEKMRAIKNEVVALKESPLYGYRIDNNNFPVIGEGSHSAEIFFVGEAPGRNEAATGRPFCGAAGKILDELLKSVGIKREEVYITNIVKDRPPQNRDPLPEEIAIYGPFLDRQIEIIKPKVIVALGRFSMRYILEKFDIQSTGSISSVHGTVFNAKASYGEVRILPFFHPAAAIYNRTTKTELEEDFKKLKEIMRNNEN